jgi:endonuclease/exonuclease/phosphatase family metal-dependent hydrolase
MHRLFSTLIASAILGLVVPGCDTAPPSAQQSYRIATFNTAMGLSQAGAMAAALRSGDDPRLKSLSEVIQLVRPDVIVLNEFDFDPTVDSAGLLNENYLRLALEGLEPIAYPYAYRPAVNTGVDSGLDLDSNGITGEPTDAWGFGTFPGQYGSLILSRFPIDEARIRSFQTLRWSQFPDALQPFNEDGAPYYPEAVWDALRLSSKNHVDIPLQLADRTVHLLVSHPTPPVFDGPEDRNGKRNHNEIGFWTHYVSHTSASWIVDDKGASGGLSAGASFVIAGDLNADPFDGDAYPGAIAQLLQHPLIDASCTPLSEGGTEAAFVQAGINRTHRGDPASDTSDFNDETVGNYRLDYVLPSRDLKPVSCGVFWPVSTSPHHEAGTFSDHRLVWVDLVL